MFQTHATTELGQALGQIGQLPEVTGEEAEKFLAEDAEVQRLLNLRENCNRKAPSGKIKIHVPVGMTMGLFGRVFTVVESGRRDFVATVPSLPQQVKEGVKMKIWDAVFKVSKVTLPQSHKQPVRLKFEPVASNVVIDPKRLPHA